MFGKLLKTISNRILASSDKLSEFAVLSNAFRYVQNFSQTVPSSQAANTLLKLLITIHEFADDKKSIQTIMGKKISAVALDFLKKDWTDATGMPFILHCLLLVHS